MINVEPIEVLDEYSDSILTVETFSSTQLTNLSCDVVDVLEAGRNSAHHKRLLKKIVLPRSRFDLADLDAQWIEEGRRGLLHRITWPLRTCPCSRGRCTWITDSLT